MNTKIGIDLDNTIACYDSVFKYLSKKFTKNSTVKTIDKKKFKSKILESNGLKKWKEIQALIYGKYIKDAEIFPGFLEFAVQSKLRGSELFIVSHKTKYGYYNTKKFFLRKASLNWLKLKNILGTKKKIIDKNHIFFETKKKDKIRRIKRLDCTHFIDDLKNVFFHNNFPKKTQKIFFSVNNEKFDLKNAKTFNTWRQISKFFYSTWKCSEITKAVNIFFFKNQIIKSEIVKGRGNSQIFKLFSNKGKKYCLKIYPDKQVDTRNRQDTEYKSTHYLSNRGFSVAKPVFKNKDLNWSIFRWETGSKVTKVDNYFIDYSINFIKKLKNNSSKINNLHFFSLATEACLSGAEIENQIKNKQKILQEQNNNKLKNFLNNNFNPSFNFFLNRAKNNMGRHFGQLLEKKYQILSPADFGAHNGIKISKKKIVFIDFEYFGWDDPVRLIGDFYWHPAMNLHKDLKKKWLMTGYEIFRKDPLFNKRLTNHLPLLGLRWCLIILNEFIKDRLQKRIVAHKKKINKKLILQKQFEKSKMLLIQINQLRQTYNNGSTI